MAQKTEFSLIGEFYKYSLDGTLYYFEVKEDKSGNKRNETTKIANHTPLLKEQSKCERLQELRPVGTGDSWS